MLDIKLRYEMSRMRKKTFKEFYNWLKDNKICPGCKTTIADNGFVKCSICRYIDRLYKEGKKCKKN